MTKRVLLIDADVLAYNAAFACETATEWEPGYWTWNVAWDEVVQAFDFELSTIMDTLGGDEAKLCLTDSEGNFRHAILPTYKGSRKGVRKPIVLKQFKQFLIDERGAYFRPGLEGDDCMGILSTRSNPDGEERVIVSIDKDMKTIPGLVCRWPMEKEPQLITPQVADYWFMTQALTGDATDGYSGCPGIGPKKAHVLLEQKNMRAMWETIVAAYAKAGLGEEEALRQARVARILRASDYDFKAKQPILWTP
jgi:DNA polymerase-1